MKEGERERGERKQGIEGDNCSRDKTLVSCYERRTQRHAGQCGTFIGISINTNNYRQTRESKNGPKHVKEILGRPTHYLFIQTFLSSHYPNCYVPLLKGDDAQAVLQMYSYLLLDHACTFSPQLLLL